MSNTQSAKALPLSVLQKIVTIHRQYVTLTKPKIMLMLLFTAYPAIFMASAGHPHPGLTLLILLGLALSTGGAASINMWYDRDIDSIMERTSSRPIPSGQIPASHALVFGIILTMLSIVELTYFVNWQSAFLAILGSLYYVWIYTMWLKRRTPQNIVIGGGAGAFPPLIGWIAMTGHLALPAILMFAIVFLWTPPHFWALALYKNEDYVRANIPMMPVTHGATRTKRESFVYTILLSCATFSMFFAVPLHFIFIYIAGISNVIFLIHSWMLLHENNQEDKWAKRTFRYSLIYLPTIFALFILCLQKP